MESKESITGGILRREAGLLRFLQLKEKRPELLKQDVREDLPRDRKKCNRSEAGASRTGAFSFVNRKYNTVLAV